MSLLSMPPSIPHSCPSHLPVSYFGAFYPDTCCLDGFLWDLDSGDEDGLTHGGDIPCPFCLPELHLQSMKQEGDIVCITCRNGLSEFRYALTSIPSIKLYGRCMRCHSLQWADLDNDSMEFDND